MMVTFVLLCFQVNNGIIVHFCTCDVCFGDFFSKFFTLLLSWYKLSFCCVLCSQHWVLRRRCPQPATFPEISQARGSLSENLICELSSTRRTFISRPRLISTHTRRPTTSVNRRLIRDISPLLSWSADGRWRCGHTVINTKL